MNIDLLNLITYDLMNYEIKCVIYLIIYMNIINLIS